MPTCTRERASERANKTGAKVHLSYAWEKSQKEGRSAIFQGIFEVLFFVLKRYLNTKTAIGP